MNPRTRKGRLSIYRNKPKTEPARRRAIMAAAEEGGPDEKMIEPATMNPAAATKLTRIIQRASHNRKRTGRYIPPQNRRDSAMAMSIVKAIKTNKVKNKAISAENSVE